MDLLHHSLKARAADQDLCLHEAQAQDLQRCMQVQLAYAKSPPPSS